MKNTGFADRLNACLDKEGFPPKNRGRIQLLAEMIGLTHRGASKWINGQSSPPAKKYEALAKKLKVNETWLRTGVGNMWDTTSISDAHVTQSALLDVNLYAVESLSSNEKVILETIKCSLLPDGQFFGITLDTEAMTPRFPKGSIIIFDNTEAKDGDFVLVDYHDFPSPIFRQLLIMNQTLYLNAHNPKFDRLILGDSRKILGKLVQAILSFD